MSTLFDELCKDAAKDIESGVYLNTGSNVVNDQVDKAVADIEKKMSDMLERTMNKVTSTGDAPVVDNIYDVPENNDGEESTDNNEVDNNGRD